MTIPTLPKPYPRYRHDPGYWRLKHQLQGAKQALQAATLHLANLEDGQRRHLEEAARLEQSKSPKPVIEASRGDDYYEHNYGKQLRWHREISDQELTEASEAVSAAEAEVTALQARFEKAADIPYRVIEACRFAGSPYVVARARQRFGGTHYYQGEPVPLEQLALLPPGRLEAMLTSGALEEILIPPIGDS